MTCFHPWHEGRREGTVSRPKRIVSESHYGAEAPPSGGRSPGKAGSLSRPSELLPGLTGGRTLWEARGLGRPSREVRWASPRRAEGKLWSWGTDRGAHQ